MANLFTRTLYAARIVHVCMQSQSWFRAVTCIRIIVYTICVSVNTQMVYTQYVCMYSLHGAKLGCVTYHDWLCASQSGASMHWSNAPELHAYVQYGLGLQRVCKQCAAHSICFAQNTYSWGSFDALRSGVMNMHATPLWFAESKSGWEGYFHSVLVCWSPRASEKFKLHINSTWSQRCACQMAVEKVNAVLR